MLSKNKIKLINSLSQKKNRKKHGLFIAEGIKVIHDIASSSLEIEEIYCNRELQNLDFLNEQQNLTVVEHQELNKVSQLKTPQGILAVVKIPRYTLHIPNLKNKLTIALDDIQDPGNMGTIIRIANWFGIQNILCSENSVDAYNPKVIQASMGAFTSVNVFYVDLRNSLELAQKNDIPVYGTFMHGENIFTSQNLNDGIVVFGNESQGISDAIARQIDRKINIPSFHQEHNKTDSLNIAIASSIVCAEFRKRKITG